MWELAQEIKDSFSESFGGIKSIKLSNYLEFKKPTYIYLQLTPSASIRNYNTDKILNIFAGLYKSINKKIEVINKKLFFECDAKMSYYIYMEKRENYDDSMAEFYFILPKVHYLLLRDKINDAWQNKVTLNTVENLPMFSKDCTKYFMTYKNKDALSMSCDKRDNVLLTSVLNTLYVMQDGDKVGVFYNFNTLSQNTWKNHYDKMLENIRNNLPMDKDLSGAWAIVKLGFLMASKIIDFAFDIIAPTSKVSKMREIALSDDSRRKRGSIVVNTQILCLSESKELQREKDNAISVCHSFDCLEGDNKLVYKKLNKKKSNEFSMLDTKIKGVPTNTIQGREGQNLISVPANELLTEHKFIKHINVLENPVPTLLQNGYIRLGVCTYRGQKYPAFLRDEINQGALPLVCIGSQSAGKTTYLSNYAKDVQSRDESIICLDYIKSCDLADTIASVTPKENLIVLDLSNIEDIQSISYNELQPKNNSAESIVEVANRKALYISTLIDALCTDDDQLSNRMDEYLNAASNIVFLNPNASLKDVVKCLNNHEYRHKCIGEMRDDIKVYLEDEIDALLELDDKDKEGNPIGTRYNKVEGINHRISLLRKDFRLKMMYKKPSDKNIDLVKAMDEGKAILIKMPQEYFANPYSRNVIVTYFFTKIWSAICVRGSRELHPKRCHVIVDEIFQAKTSMKLLSDQELLPQTRKFNCKFVFSCQYLGQIKQIDQTLRSAGASYMLMTGSGKSTYNEFKEELFPYTLDDIESLPQYHSLNIINHENGRSKFITALPPVPH